MATEEGALARWRDAKPISRFWYTWGIIPARNLILWVFRVRVINRKVVPFNKPYIIVANHVALFDPMWVYSAARGGLHPVATEDLFRKPFLSNLVAWCGAFPKRKAAQDMTAVKNIRKILSKHNRPVIIFPEGIRTWDGRLAPIPEGIGSLIRLMKVPVIGARQDGAYLAQPRWASKYRWFPLRITFEKLFDGDNLPKENGPIVEKIGRYLAADDYELRVDEKRLRTNGLARNVNTLIYRCPNCQTWEGLKVVLPDRTNQVQCASCFSLWRLTPTHRLIPLDADGHPVGERLRLDEVYRTIRAFPIVPIETSVPLQLDAGETLLLSSRRHVLRKEGVFPRIRDLAVGRLYLTNRRLIFRSRERIVLRSRSGAPRPELRGGKPLQFPVRKPYVHHRIP